LRSARAIKKAREKASVVKGVTLDRGDYRHVRGNVNSTDTPYCMSARWKRRARSTSCNWN